MSCISPAALRSCQFETQVSNEVDKRVVTLFKKNKQPLLTETRNNNSRILFR